MIKSHHNVGGLPDDMKMGLVEPLRELFKDEVRKIGLELGLPYNMLYRHPFPGPGLGVRVLGEVKKEYCDLLRRADAIFIEELHAADSYNKVLKPLLCSCQCVQLVSWAMAVSTIGLCHCAQSKPSTL